MSRDFYLNQRKNGIFYVQFKNPENGKPMTAKSTGEKDRRKAEEKAIVWKSTSIPTGRTKIPKPLEDAGGMETIIKAIRRTGLSPNDALRIVSMLKNKGLIDIAAVENTGRGAVPFVKFLETFWNFDESPYIQDKLAHGYRFTRGYALQSKRRIKTKIKAFFGDKKMNLVTTDDLKKFSRQLSDSGLATATINLYLLTCCTPLKWAFNERIITSNPAIGLTKFSVTNKKRNILTEAEVAAVLAAEWRDKRAFVASLVSATTGARQGEILALRSSDIGEDEINIAHSYSRFDGLKCPKNGKDRRVPLLPEVKAALLDLLQDNPYTDLIDPFIFFSLKPDRPVDQKVILKGLTETLAKIDVDYKGRNIAFHSWRHWFVSKITEVIDGEKVARVSGHLSEAIFKKYADHIEKKNIDEVGKAAAQVFGNVLQFKKVG